MKLSFIHRILLFILCFVVSVDGAWAQPCTFSPPITSEDINGNPTTVICNSNPLTLSTTSQDACPACTYLWSDGTTGPYAFAFSPGVYSVTVTDNAPGGCVGVSASLNITNTTLNVPNITGNLFVCKDLNGTTTLQGALLQVTNPCPTCMYQWFDSLNAALPLSLTPTLGATSYDIQNQGSYYVRVSYPTNPDSFCVENSAMVTISQVIVSEPPLSSSGLSICDSNTITLSTINCAGCSYEWLYYATPPEGRLIISGVFDGNVAGGQPKGIELYAIGNIPDLSLYGVNVSSNGSASNGWTGAFKFPAGSLAAGSYIYLTQNATGFSNFFGFSANYTSAIVNINGNDAIELYYNDGTPALIDIYGSSVWGPLVNCPDQTDVSDPDCFVLPWAYRDGWAYRDDNMVPTTTFNPADWGIFPNILDSCSTNFTTLSGCLAPACCTYFPMQTFTSNASSTTQQTILGANSSTFTTGVTGIYSVSVTYPSGCSRESDAITIDTSIFNPRIRAVMPDLVGSGVTISATDTSYLCFNSYVDLLSINPFVAPPTWTYQWYRNGVPITGATGFNHRTYTSGVFSVKVTNSDGCQMMSNVIVVLTSNNGANPSISATSLFLCSGGPSSILSTPNISGCTYRWYTEDGTITLIGSGILNTYAATLARGYYVLVTDVESGCIYSTPILEIKDTTYPAPLLTTSGNVACSATPIILSTTPCAGCDYLWKKENINGNFITKATTQQFTYQIDSAGKYRVEILYPNGCQTTFSNTIQATFQTVNAIIATPPLTSICNGQVAGIRALPDTSNCVGCVYTFLRDGVAMQPILPRDSQTISLEGDYQVVVRNSDNCSDTSSIVSFNEVNISTDIRQSAGKICGPTHSVALEIDRCTGCAYQWYLGPTALISNQDTFFIATGYAAATTYVAEVSKLGCVVRDTVDLDSVLQRTIHITIDSAVNTSPTICNGASVFLLDTCQNCISQNLYRYQWFFNNDTITGASFESYQVDTPGLYYVKIVDADNCHATSNQITVQEFTAPSNFALDFSPLGPAVPITYGTMDMDNYLTPSSLHTTGIYSSLTAGGALGGGVRRDILNVGAAGSGYHYIRFTYTQSNALGSCTFSTQDTLEVLGAMAMDVVNSNASAPAFEACLFDSLTVSITNFTFIPTHVVFVAGGGNTISVPVTPTVTAFAGVYTGTFTVTVPDGARTGKLTLTDGTNSFESPNFFVVQNPAVTIDLLGTVQPVCSILDTAVFSGLPVGGLFSAHYIGQATNPSLTSTNNLLLNNISGYVNGVQNVMMLYTYQPTYTGTSVPCPQTVKDSLLVEIRDSELDSVVYTPIAISQISEAMDNLTLITDPVSARYYPKTYSGTYIVSNTLYPSTITSGPGNQSITYEINNGGCINSSEDSINIWRKPAVLDAIPDYLCQRDDTVYIQRNVDSLWVIYRGQVIYSDTLYKYSTNTGLIGPLMNPEVTYSEEYNRMTITTTNGGLDTVNLSQSNLMYYFVPANVVGGSTTLNFKFEYLRTSSYFDGSGGPPVVENTRYTIAEVSKLIRIEVPPVVGINPVILADTIFCPQNTNHLFLGQPAGGQYYINSAAIPSNIFNPTLYPSGNSYRLTYIYTGQACIDSAITGIYLPNPFSIDVAPSNGTGEYCKTSPNDPIYFTLLPPNVTHPVDTASAQFFIGGIQSSTIFSPLQVGPPGDYYVRYVVSDIYGCPQEALDTFTVFPIPDLSISAINPIYCLNEDSTQIHLYQTSALGVVNELTYTGIGYVQGETVTLLGTGLGSAGTNPSTPYFFPATAGVGVHGLSYVYTDSNSCMDSINITVRVLPLPSVLLTTSGGAPLQPYYCENDIVPLFGLPIGTAAQSGYGSDTSTLYGNPLINNLYPSSLDIPNRLFKPNVAGTQPGLLTEVLFYYYVDNNGCRDTARRTVTIRNFTTDPVITGFPQSGTPLANVVCASDLEITINGSPNGGFDLDSLGWFTSPYTDAFSQLGPVPNTATTMFYPDSAGIVFAGRYVQLTFHYTDTSRNCFNSVSDSIWVNALPYLTLSEALVGAGTLANMDPPGSQLIVPATDTFHHICETAPIIPIFAYNTTGLYNPFTGTIILAAPDHISSDTGTYALGDGVQWNLDPVNRAYGYISGNAGPGLDTIRYIYRDAKGCIDSIDHIIVVDSLPPLSFAGLSNYDPVLGKFVYCETAPNPPLILPSPIGVDWTLTFNGQPITSIPFQLRPDTLAVPGVYMDYPIKYNYIGQIYESGGVCSDSLSQIIQIRPAPVLNWVNVPNSYCILDTLERLPLSATPTGGVFTDVTPGLNGIPGIVADTLFDPSAQPGRRDIVYYYMNTVSGCDDTIQHTIYVYNKPRINFDIDGGCSGTQVEFIPTTYPYGLKYNTVAIDSLTLVVWNYGDGVIDTIDYLPDTLQIPTAMHTYSGSGVFYPSLTVVNQGICDTTFTRRIVISPMAHPTDTVPYQEFFDAGPGGWIQESADTLSVNGIVQDSLWQWGLANGMTINTAFANNPAWVTRLNETYRQGENAWVYSPCFDLTSLERPMIELSIWRDAQNHVDGAVLQYHDDVSNEWKVLGEHGKGINWYQEGFVVSTPGNQTGTPVGWTDESSGWENARYRLDNIGNDLRHRTNVRFRIAFASSPNTLVGINDGFAFDSVRIGNRTRNVLTEHFSGTGYPGIETIENQLYHTIYNNLYGRDVCLIQYHTNRYTNDALYQFNPVDVNARMYDYGITDANQVRVDGKDLVSKTSDLLSYPLLEYLDVECLEDPKFELEFGSFPPVEISGNAALGYRLKTIIRTTAMEDMNTFGTDEYILHVVVTEDDLMTVTNHSTLAVMRAMLPTYAGYSYTQGWAAGDMVSDTVIWNFTHAAHPDYTKLKVTAFIKNVETSEVYQVISSRNITVFQGPVDTLDVSIDKVEDRPGWEIVNMKLFPNPTQDLFNVSFDQELTDDYEWELVDAVGRTLKTGNVQKGTKQMQVETHDLMSGMYIFVLKNNYIYTQRKVIVHKP